MMTDAPAHKSLNQQHAVCLTDFARDCIVAAEEVLLYSASHPSIDRVLTRLIKTAGRETSPKLTHPDRRRSAGGTDHLRAAETIVSLVTDAARALLVACAALAVALIQLSIAAIRADPASPQRLIAELRLAQFAALLLVLTASVYIGFALAHGSTTGSGLDVALGVGFLVLASVAITKDPGLALTLLAVAFAGHGVVDLLHSAEVLPAEALPDWYATACAMYNVAIAAVCYLPIVRRP